MNAALLLGGLAALPLLLLHPQPAGAVASQTWRQRDRGEFEKGEPKGVSLSADGAIRLSPRLDAFYEAAQPYVWALAEDRKGTLYAAGGSAGAVYRIGPSGKGDLFFRAEDPEVHALATDASGNLYAGTAPGGRVYKVSPEGKVVWVCETGETYVWALQFDRQMRLHAATGIEGRLIVIDPSGKKDLFFDSAETHVRSLALDAEGNLIAGTDGHGLVLRVSPRGEGFVLYDAPLNEVAALALGPDGTVYASVVGEGARGGRGDRPSPPVPAPSPTPGPDQGGAPGSTPAQPPDSQAAAQEQRIPILMEGKVLAISPKGYAREVWSGSQEAIFSLTLGPPGTLLMGSGVQGKIYALNEDATTSEIARAPSSQVTVLLRRATGKDVAVAGSNFGSVSLLRGGYAPSGTYESRVFDARSFATWGRLAWRAEVPKGTTVAVSARSGNTEEPDRTWSDWGPALADPAGTLLDRPAARFLQYRALLKSDDPARSPVLREVAVTYLQANLPPEIRKIEVQAPGVSIQKIPAQPPSPEAKAPGSGSGEGDGGARRRGRPQSRRGFDAGARSVSWQASDPNDDDLLFDVYYRATDETAWKPLRKGIDEDFATWDGAAMPDGTYVVRVVVSDAPSNPAGQALAAEKISDAFDVDGTPPRVEGLKAQPLSPAIRLSFSVEDSFSIVREAAYSIDAADWVLARPADGLNDSSREAYDLTLPALPSGEHTVVVRATDAAGNTGAGRLIVRVP
jgi:hypothetical protein